MGDSLEEALNVLRGHAVGTPGDLASLLNAGGSSTSSLLTQAFNLAGRMVRIVCVCVCVCVCGHESEREQS